MFRGKTMRTNTIMFTGRTGGLVRTAAAGLMLLGSAAAVSAQTGVDPGRAFRGLFADAGASTTTLSLSADIYQGIQRPAAFDGTEPQEMFSGISPSLLFTRSGRGTTFGASAGATTRYYANAGSLRTLYEGAAVGLRHQFGRLAVQLQQSVVRQPTLRLGLAPASFGGSSLGVLDHGTVEQVGDGDGLLSSSSRIALGLQPGRYFWVSAGYGYEYFEFRGPAASLGLFNPVSHRQEAHVSASRRFGRSTALRAGLRSVKGTGATSVANDRAAWIHNIDIGLDRLQNISLTRTTTLSLNGGAGFVRQEATEQAPTLVALGGVGLDKRFGKRTRLSMTARRDLYFVDGLRDPVLTNGVTGRFDLPVGRRWTFSANTGASKGRAMAEATSPDGTSYTSTFVELRTMFRLRGPVSIYGEYLRFEQSFDRNALPSLYGREETRTGLRFGVVLNVPILGERGVE
jgi:hypothetical protein